MHECYYYFVRKWSPDALVDNKPKRPANTDVIAWNGVVKTFELGLPADAKYNNNIRGPGGHRGKVKHIRHAYVHNAPEIKVLCFLKMFLDTLSVLAELRDTHRENKVLGMLSLMKPIFLEVAYRGDNEDGSPLGHQPISADPLKKLADQLGISEEEWRLEVLEDYLLASS